MLTPKRSVLARALELFGAPVLAEATHGLQTTFACLAGELFTRAAIVDPTPPFEAYRARAFMHVQSRESALFARLELLNWMQRALAGEAEASYRWGVFASLTIADFHEDLVRLVNAVAPAVLRATEWGRSAAEGHRPGFADISSTSERSKALRSLLPGELLAVIDETGSWWPAVKRIRVAVAYKPHHLITFSGPTNGVLFQLYEPATVPNVLDPNFLWPHGKNVVDFRLYSAYVVAQLLVFLDDLGIQLAAHLKLSRDGLQKSQLCGDFGFLLDSMRALEAALPSK